MGNSVTTARYNYNYNSLKDIKRYFLYKDLKKKKINLTQTYFSNKIIYKK